MVWKLLSLDLTSLSAITYGPALYELNPEWLRTFIQEYSPRIFASAAQIKFVQFGACAALLLAFYSLQRVVIILGILPILFIEWTCYQYRAHLYENSLLLSLIIVMLAGPFSWREGVLKRDRNPNSDATGLGLMGISYVGLMYFLAGLSKPLSDPQWWLNVHLENIEEAMYTWHNAIPPGFLFHTAHWIGQAFTHVPHSSSTAAFLTMLFELTWFTAILFRIARQWIPPALFLTHVMILLGSGIS